MNSCLVVIVLLIVYAEFIEFKNVLGIVMNEESWDPLQSQKMFDIKAPFGRA